VSPHLNLPNRVTLVEVSPRDGLQSESYFVPTDKKIALIERLVSVGVKRIEATSFVSPKWVPQLADAEQVVAGITRYSDLVGFQGLVLNQKGYERVRHLGLIREIALVVAASESVNHRNSNMTVGESMSQLTRIVRTAKADGIRVRGTIGVAFVCPYEGRIPLERTLNLTGMFVESGCDEVALADTIGQAMPDHVYELFSRVRERWPDIAVAGHFHDARQLALTNIFAAMQAGVGTFDCSVGGLGGCQFTKGAPGNVATEQVVYMLSEMGIDTGINYSRLLDVAEFALDLTRPRIPRSSI
jgi:hydroxymethylglutaryl-CoA lyase